MKIAPISFGKAVRVNGTEQQAFDIARLANEKKASNAERSAHKEAKAIFDDVDVAQAQVVTYKTPYNQTEVYIVSGTESKKLDRLNDELTLGIIQAGNALEDSRRFQTSTNRQMNNYNQKVRNLLLNTATNYNISAKYDKSGTRVKVIDREYDSVYAVAGTKEQLSKLNDIISNSKGKAIVLDATDLYKQGKTDGLCAKAVSEGKKVSFIVTGMDSCKNISHMQFGWSSINGISRRLQRFIDLRNTEEQAKTIQEAMEYDYKKGQK